MQLFSTTYACRTWWRMPTLAIWGGELSHEYHFVSANGEDTIIGCDKCDFSINEELYVGRLSEAQDKSALSTKDRPQFWTGISKDRKTLIHVCYPGGDRELNVYRCESRIPGPGLKRGKPKGLPGKPRKRKRTPKLANPNPPNSSTKTPASLLNKPLSSFRARLQTPKFQCPAPNDTSRQR